VHPETPPGSLIHEGSPSSSPVITPSQARSQSVGSLAGAPPPIRPRGAPAGDLVQRHAARRGLAGSEFKLRSRISSLLMVNTLSCCVLISAVGLISYPQVPFLSIMALSLLASMSLAGAIVLAGGGTVTIGEMTAFAKAMPFRSSGTLPPRAAKRATLSPPPPAEQERESDDA
jgi:hypothetical protein